MSSGDQDSNLVAGHAPATKVAGGHRIVQNKPPQSHSDNTKEDKEAIANAGVDPKDVNLPSEKALASGGAPDQNMKHKEDAVRAMHEKPHMSHGNAALNNPPNIKAQNHQVFQPRKQ